VYALKCQDYMSETAKIRCMISPFRGGNHPENCVGIVRWIFTFTPPQLPSLVNHSSIAQLLKETGENIDSRLLPYTTIRQYMQELLEE
jgi:hypothetical protein